MREPCTCGPDLITCPACRAYTRESTASPTEERLYLYGQPIRWCKYKVTTIRKVQALHRAGVKRTEIVRRTKVPYSTIGYLKDIRIVEDRA